MLELQNFTMLLSRIFYYGYIPMDEQRCNLRILSYAYVIEEVEISWNENEPITRNPNIAMSDMHIIDLSPGLCDGNYSTGTWSCVTAEFFVKREITHHVMQSYVPTTLIVVISWFSFWLDVEAVVARVSLAITTLLTLSTQSNAARMALPEVSYMKAIDVWMGACMMFVFGVMIEFTIVNYAQRQKSEKKEETEDEKNEKEKDIACYRKLLKHARVWLTQKFHIGNKNLQLKEQEETNNTYCKNGGDSTISATGSVTYGSFAKRQRIITLENGSPKINGTPLRRDEDRKKRESERLANWMKSENSCFINSDQNSNILQARKKVSDVSSTSDQPGGYTEQNK
uniref:Neurotransmitter-gated ion-channel transmembrane domain-containing protein n=1 Tax=Acrobeloides nanus TaxID=290746 RepID=A0A914EHW0_9BILA